MKKNIMLIIMTIVVCVVGTSYAAYKLKAEQVSFDKNNTGLNSDDVQGAIDELATDILTYGDANPNDILEGKTALVNGKKVVGNFNLPKVMLQFCLEAYEWSSITIEHNKNYKSVSIFNGSTCSETRTLLIYKGSTQIGKLSNGQNATYSMEDGKAITIKTLVGSGAPCGYFILNP